MSEHRKDKGKLTWDTSELSIVSCEVMMELAICFSSREICLFLQIISSLNFLISTYEIEDHKN